MATREMPAREVAELLLQLPQGCRVSRAVGGAWAWTDEVVAQLSHSHLVRQIWWVHTGKKGSAPEAPKPPKGWLVEQQEKAKAAADWQKRAEAWRRDNAAMLAAQATE